MSISVIRLWRSLETFIVIYYFCYTFSTNLFWRQRPRHKRRNYVYILCIFISDYYCCCCCFIWLSKWHVHVNECNVIWPNDVRLLRRHFSYLSVFWIFFFLFCFYIFLFYIFIFACYAVGLCSVTPTLKQTRMEQNYYYFNLYTVSSFRPLFLYYHDRFLFMHFFIIYAFIYLLMFSLFLDEQFVASSLFS